MNPIHCPSGAALARGLAPLALLGAGSACAKYVPAEQDLAFGYEAATDVLTLRMDSRGLHAQSEDGLTFLFERVSEEDCLEQAVEALSGAAGGAPYLAPLGFPFALDLAMLRTEAADELVDADDAAQKQLIARGIRAIDGTEVARAGLYLDGAGEVGLYQEVRIQRAQELIALVNDLVDAAVVDGPSLVSENGGASAQHAALVHYAESGADWVVLDKDGIEVRLPFGPRVAAEYVRNFTEFPVDGESGSGESGSTEPWEEDVDAAILRALFVELDTFEVEDGVARLRYSFGEDGSVVLPFRGRRAPEQAAGLRARLEAVIAASGGDELEVLDAKGVAARFGRAAVEPSGQ